EAAAEFIAHARAIRAERAAAIRERRTPQLAPLLNAWGGATIAYRRRFIDAPSYTLNHEEVAKALEEGIHFAEKLTPTEVVLDNCGRARALKVLDGSGADAVMPARTILVAAGTQPNPVLGRESAEEVLVDGKYFQAIDETGAPVRPERSAKPSA